MKLKHLASLSLAVGAAFGANAMAADATVTFKGEVRGSTCIPTIGGETNGVVALDPIVESMFHNVTNTTAEKTFEIALTGCNDAANTVVKAYFYQDNATQGRLNKTTGTGTGWTYQLLNADGTAQVNVGTSGLSITPSDADGGTTVTSGTGTLTYKVRYYREQANITNGTLHAKASYVLYTN